MSARLEGRGLTLFRGERCLFQGLDFSLSAGELLLVQGPNGSGKTSLLRTVAGLAELEEGEVLWNGIPVARERQEFRGRLVWMGHRPGYKAELTVRENLAFEAGLRPASRRSPAECLARLGLAACAELPFGVLSAGQQRRLALARLLLAAAPLWMVDEPYTNLDSTALGLVNELLAAHLAAGGLAMVASHQPVALAAPVRHVTLA